jgi:hypothetical protein
VAAVSPTPAPAALPAVGGGSVALTLEGGNRIKVGEETIVSVVIRADQPLVSTALQLGFDPRAVKILEVVEGGLLRDDGAQTTFSARTDEAAGRVFIGVARPVNVPGAIGEGTLVQLRVEGLAPAAAAPFRVVVFSGIGPGNSVLSAPLPAALDLVVTEP